MRPRENIQPWFAFPFFDFKLKKGQRSVPGRDDAKNPRLIGRESIGQSCWSTVARDETRQPEHAAKGEHPTMVRLSLF
jgi:hypothetical protein